MLDTFFNPTAFDILSLLLSLKSLQVAWRLRQAWPSLWGSAILPEHQHLAGEVAFFLLLPLAVLAHELGHALATWQVGGEVRSFQWRVFWGYVVPSGDFTSLHIWWIALSGDLPAGGAACAATTADRLRLGLPRRADDPPGGDRRGMCSPGASSGRPAAAGR